MHSPLALHTVRACSSQDSGTPRVEEDNGQQWPAEVNCFYAQYSQVIYGRVPGAVQRLLGGLVGWAVGAAVTVASNSHPRYAAAPLCAPEEVKSTQQVICTYSAYHTLHCTPFVLLGLSWISPRERHYSVSSACSP